MILNSCCARLLCPSQPPQVTPGNTTVVLLSNILPAGELRTEADRRIVSTRLAAHAPKQHRQQPAAPRLLVHTDTAA